MLALDHIIVAAKEPKTAALAFASKNHIKTIEGGKHEKWGTYNHLAYFANNCYIEWLGIFNQRLANQSVNPLIQQLILALDNSEEGPIQFALRTENMTSFIKHFDTAMTPYIGPIDGHRKKPNGMDLTWQMLFPQPKKYFPFLIQWGNSMNVPDDKQLINKQNITNIATTLPVNEFKALYQHRIQANHFQLANTNLQFEEEKKLMFSISE
ncbi:VOC family protein [Virgibacillus salexigens]|uniref:VOC family protein n=1 Tax=Virgibacillus salexigens TaxID=61016 RepID=UPI00190D91B1|nr:VOC family protein [Virgibacillus salexigens]